jgi:hypothetical protein
MNDMQKIIGHINFEVIIAIFTSLFTVIGKIYVTKKKRHSLKQKALIKSEKTTNYIHNQLSDTENEIIGNANKVSRKNVIEGNLSHRGTKSKPRVLKIFILIALLYLLITTIVYWDNIVITKQTLLTYIGLFLMMCGGMFVSVIRRNYKSGKELFDVRDSDLIYPLLFSVFVFYPILIMVDSEQNSKLLFYTAFLNGYFWKTIVTEAEENRSLKE